jgi:hypothetical protein
MLLRPAAAAPCRFAALPCHGHWGGKHSTPLLLLWCACRGDARLQSRCASQQSIRARRFQAPPADAGPASSTRSWAGQGQAAAVFQFSSSTRPPSGADSAGPCTDMAVQRRNSRCAGHMDTRAAMVLGQRPQIRLDLLQPPPQHLPGAAGPPFRLERGDKTLFCVLQVCPAAPVLMQWLHCSPARRSRPCAHAPAQRHLHPNGPFAPPSPTELIEDWDPVLGTAAGPAAAAAAADRAGQRQRGAGQLSFQPACWPGAWPDQVSGLRARSVVVPGPGPNITTAIGLVFTVVVPGPGPTARYGHALSCLDNRSLVAVGVKDDMKAFGGAWVLDLWQQPLFFRWQNIPGHAGEMMPSPQVLDCDLSNWLRCGSTAAAQMLPTSALRRMCAAATSQWGC